MKTATKTTKTAKNSDFRFGKNTGAGTGKGTTKSAERTARRNANHEMNQRMLAEVGPKLVASLHAAVASYVGDAQTQTFMDDTFYEYVEAFTQKIDAGTAAGDWFLNQYGKEAGFDRNLLTHDNFGQLLVDVVSHSERVLSEGISAERVAKAVETMTFAMPRFDSLPESSYRSFTIHVNATNHIAARQAGKAEQADAGLDKLVVMLVWAMENEKMLASRKTAAAGAGARA